MSFSKAASRSLFRRTSTLRRYVSSEASSSSTPSSSPSPSTSTSTPKAPEFALSDERLRALIALYHRSDSFITHENLSDAIDEAFIWGPSQHTATRQKDMSFFDLLSQVKKQKLAPKFGRPEGERPLKVKDEKGRRIEQVFQALYGTEATRKPGLEILQERWVEVQERLRQEREMGESEGEGEGGKH